MSYQERELTREQKFVITLLIIAAITGILGYVAFAGFAEAGHNRIKEQRMWNSCIIAKQNAIECKVAIYGNNG